MLLWMDGFDKYGSGSGGATKMLDGIYGAITGWTPKNTQVRTGLFAFGDSNPGQNQSFNRIFGGAKSIVGVGYALWISNLPNDATDHWFARYQNSLGADICTICLDAVGQFVVRTGSNSGTIRATSSIAINTSAWNHVEIKTRFHATLGSCEIRVNGVTVLNATNINTDAAGGGVADRINIGHQIGDIGSTYIDDFFA